MLEKTILDEEQLQNNEDFQMGLKQDFKLCESYALECPNCGKLKIVRECLEKLDDNTIVYSLGKCSECKMEYSKNVGKILKTLTLLMKYHVKRTIQSPFICDDIACRAEVIVPQYWTDDGLVCFKCQHGLMRKRVRIFNVFELSKASFLVHKSSTIQSAMFLQNDIRFGREFEENWTKSRRFRHSFGGVGNAQNLREILGDCRAFPERERIQQSAFGSCLCASIQGPFDTELHVTIIFLFDLIFYLDFSL